MVPRVSIGMPVYNGERYITEALDSILAQDFEDYEVIISDNASTDRTQEICEAYAQRDPRIRYSRLPENLGAAGNFNRVFEMSSGQLFKWAAYDDRIKRNFLRTCIERFDSLETAPGVVYTRTELIDERGLVMGPNEAQMHSHSTTPFVRAFQAIQGMGAVADAVFGVFSRRILEKTRLIGSFYAADRVLMLETALLGRIVQVEGEPLFQRRVHPGISTKAHRSNQERLHWYDPEARLTVSPEARVVLEYLRSSMQSPELNLVEKTLCVPWTLVGVAVRETRVPLGRYRRRLSLRLAGRKG